MLKDIYNSIVKKPSAHSNHNGFPHSSSSSSSNGGQSQMLVDSNGVGVGVVAQANEFLENQSQLFFSLKSIKGIKIPENNTPIKIYCLASIEKQTVQTSSIILTNETTDIEWNEGYTFDVMSSNSILSLSIWQSFSKPINNNNNNNNYNNNTFETPITNEISFQSVNNNNNININNNISHRYSNSGKLLGKLSITFSTFQKQYIDQWLPLSNSNGISVHIKLSYTSSNKKATVDDFIYLRMIGKGAFGQVNLVKKIDTGRLYAMKIIKKDRCLDMNAVQHTFTERELLKKYYHPFIVGLKYSFQTQDSLCMVLDYIGGGELFYHISERETFSEDTARFYISQIMLAIGFLHEHGVIYRDLKLENLLMDLDGNICLVDLGLCKEGVKDGVPTFTMCGSPEYIAPEILSGSGYGRSVDWWGLGTLLYEMISGLPPFYSEDPQEMSRMILSGPLKFPPNLSKTTIHLLTQLLNRDPTKRLGSGDGDVEEIKNHPFFKSINWNKLANKEIDPPFKPHLNGPLDLSYFDPSCTIHSQPIHPNTINTNLSETDQMAFHGFSYSAPPELFSIIKNKQVTNLQGITTSNNSSASNSLSNSHNSGIGTPPQNFKHLKDFEMSISNGSGRNSPSSPNLSNFQQTPLQSQTWVHSQYPNLQHPLPHKPLLSKFQETTFERRRSLSISAQTQFSLALDDNELMLDD